MGMMTLPESVLQQPHLIVENSGPKAARTGEVRQEPNVAVFRKNKRQVRLIVDDRGPPLALHTCDLNLKRIAE